MTTYLDNEELLEQNEELKKLLRMIFDTVQACPEFIPSEFPDFESLQEKAFKMEDALAMIDGICDDNYFKFKGW